MTSSQGGASAYVALGDSISIDLYAGGPRRGGASLLARNRDEDFPDWRNRDLATTRPELGFALLATDGATTASVLDFQLPRLASVGLVPRIVTLTVGGNDVLGAYGDTRLALEMIGVVGARVGRALDRLRALVRADAPVIVGTVYDPSDGTSEAWRVGLPPWPDVAAVVVELNETLKRVAAEHGALVADIHQRFLGHGLQAGNPAQPTPRPRDRTLWYCNIIEPNAWGADAVRAALWAALQAHGECERPNRDGHRRRAAHLRPHASHGRCRTNPGRWRNLQRDAVLPWCRRTTLGQDGAREIARTEVTAWSERALPAAATPMGGR